MTAGNKADVCAERLASMKCHRMRPGIASLAPSSTSWTTAATGDSCSHRHAALWVLFCCLAQGCKTERVGVWLYCVPGIRGSFYVRAMRLQTASSRLPVSVSFLFFSPALLALSSDETRTHWWTSEQMEMQTRGLRSADPFRSLVLCSADKEEKRNIAPCCT